MYYIAEKKRFGAGNHPLEHGPESDRNANLGMNGLWEKMCGSYIN